MAGLGFATTASSQIPGLARDTTQAPPPITLPPAEPAPRPLQPSLVDSTVVTLRGPLLDAPISRTEYPLGPGDVLQVAVFGEFNRLFTLTITPEGSLVIPGVGIAPLLGLNLEQAERRVRELAARLFRNVNVRVTLAQVRSFKVFVVGNVVAPGIRAANAATRVSELVTQPAEAGDPRLGRNITLRRASGETLHVDLVRFMQTGDVSANPALREGDAIVVPRRDEVLYLFGHLQYPGAYEFRPGESLAELLTVANGGGGFPSNAADSVRVVRFVGPQQRTHHVFSQAEATGAAGRAFLLQPFDGIYVAAVANFMEQHFASIRGQVMRPGVYPIRSDTTTVRELVEMAGGFTPLASLVDATLRRHPTSRARDELSRIPAELMSRQDLRIVQVRGAADTTSVVIDFSELFTPGSPAYQQTLRSGDVVNVPVRRVEVHVLGAVRNPGMIAYYAGTTVQEYVAAAGGLSRRADLRRAVLLRARTGARLQLSEAGVVEPGDALIVPFREELSPGETLQTLALIASTITGAILAGVAVFGNR